MQRITTSLFRHKNIRAFWQFISFTLSFPLFLLGLCIPEKKSLWLFANTFGYRDNARYLYEYVKKYHPDITAVWISSSKDDASLVAESYGRYTLYGIWLQYRAGLCFASTGMGDFVRFALAGKMIIQLWHGIPIKKILLDSRESLPFPNGPAIISTVSGALLRWTLHRYTLVIASSEEVKKRMASAFGLPEECVAVTGYPRHDIIFENALSGARRILYAPTWRPDLDTMQAIIQSICNWEFLNQLQEQGYELQVALHPLSMQLLERVDREIIEAVHLYENEDINIVLSQAEILITDYSSIALDFVMLNRQVILFTPDVDIYFEERGVYEEFETIFLEKGVKDVKEILPMICAGESVFDSELCRRLFQFSDSGARERIVSIAKKTCSMVQPEQVKS